MEDIRVHGHMSEKERLQVLDALLQKASVYSEFLQEEMEQVHRERADQREEGDEEELAVSAGSKRAADSDAHPVEGSGRKRRPDAHGASPSVENAWVDLVPHLREYQVVGVKWLCSLYDNGMNGILADEMGLGKTVQSIGLLCCLLSRNVQGPFLVVAPLSTIHNWHREFQRFAPAVDVLVYHADPEERKRMFAESLSGSALASGAAPHVVITTYDLIIRDESKMASVNWKFVVVDEAHRLKNFDCKLFHSMKKIPSENRILLTGTPLQNNLSELWSLLNFVLPEVFPDCAAFEELFDFSEDARILESQAKSQVLTKLHRILSPFVLRRLKSDVLQHLPSKREVVLFSVLSPLQVEMSQAILEGRIHEWLERKRSVDPEEGRSSSRAASGGLQMKLIQLRKCHNHPCIFGACVLNQDSDVKKKEEEQRQKLEERMEKRRKNRGSSRVSARLASTSVGTLVDPLSDRFDRYFLEGQDMMDSAEEGDNLPQRTPEEQSRFLEELHHIPVDALLETSRKMQLLDRLLEQCEKLGKQVLLFCQMTRMMDLLEVYLDSRQLRFCRIDGSVSVEERQRLIDAFNHDPSIRVFLLSTRSGGMGINLASADTVVFYDNDWNPHVDLQAQDRCHRIGQEKEVTVIRLVSYHSVDEYVLSRAAKKKALDRVVLHRKKFKGKQEGDNEDELLDQEELLRLLRRDFGDSETTSSPSSSSGTRDGLAEVSDETLELILSGGLADLPPSGAGFMQVDQPSSQ